ncbi:TOG array regulator of axonemal microtubules protein 2-like [Columba livia]|uniref:TOG array regulator of axonemal microtubules protein 2-like n=1 Tax=Columba livia TaxID=8932 RepID=UPI0031B9EFD8
MPVNESSAEQALPLHSSTCHAVPWLRSLSDVGSDGSWETWCFLSAKYHTSIAVYCRSVPQFKPRHKALRGGSIDSNLQFRGSSWTTEEGASFQSILTIEMKKQQRFLNEDADGDGRKPNAIPPLDDWASEADVQDFSTGQGGDHPHLSHQALTQDPQEREASSADSGTIQIKDKLKTKRMSEGLSASYRGLTDCDDPTGVTLKPVDSGSASQKLRVTSKTMSATQNRPVSSETSMLSDGEQEHGENDTDYGASDEDNMELMSESKGYKVRKPSQACVVDLQFISSRQSSEIFFCSVSPGKQLSQGSAQLSCRVGALLNFKK